MHYSIYPTVIQSWRLLELLIRLALVRSQTTNLANLRGEYLCTLMAHEYTFAASGRASYSSQLSTLRCSSDSWPCLFTIPTPQDAVLLNLPIETTQYTNLDKLGNVTAFWFFLYRRNLRHYMYWQRGF